jgi:hypothetical protein
MQEGLRMEIGEGRKHTISGGSAHTDEITDILPGVLIVNLLTYAPISIGDRKSTEK